METLNLQDMRSREIHAAMREELEKEVVEALGTRYAWAIHTEPVKRAIAVGAMRLTELQGRHRSDQFWSMVVFPEGADAETIKEELAAWHFVMDQIGEIYMTLTGGLLSKHNYYAGTILSEFEAHLQECIEEGVKEELEEQESRLPELLDLERIVRRNLLARDARGEDAQLERQSAWLELVKHFQSEETPCIK